MCYIVFVDCMLQVGASTGGLHTTCGTLDTIHLRFFYKGMRFFYKSMSKKHANNEHAR